MVTWLKDNRHPEAQVQNFMKKTAPSRLKQLQESDKLGPVLLKYPRLLDTPGMIEQDFSLLYPDHALKLYEMWGNRSYKVLEWAAMQSSSWRKYISLPEALTEDQTNSAAFHVLPYLLPTGMFLLKGGKRTKYSKAEAAKAFIDCQPVGTNLPLYLKALEDDLEKNKDAALRKQPFVLILGDILSPTQCFLITELMAMPHGSIMAAVDACFKAFYVLNVEYPAACKNVWSFIQHGCYHVKGNEKDITSTVRSLITIYTKE